MAEVATVVAPDWRRAGRLAAERAAESATQRTAVGVVPVLPPLEPLLPQGGLRRGSTVAVSGSTALLLALLAGPSRAGAWCAVVGLPSLGTAAAAESGVALERLALVPTPGPDWASAVAVLLDGLDVVAVAPPARTLPGDLRRLAARVRQRGSVLLPFGEWAGADLRMSVTSGDWSGLLSGAGRLRSRQVTAQVTGRGRAARPRRATMLLPDPTGGLGFVPTRPAEPTPLLSQRRVAG